MFDLWRAERRARKERDRLRAHYRLLIAQARAAKDSARVQELEHEHYTDDLQVDEDHVLRTNLLVQRARRLGVPVPPRQEPWTPQFDQDGNWYFNQMNGNFTLTDKARRSIIAEIRHEEDERFKGWVRWVNQVILPVLSLLIALASLALAFFRHK